MRADLQERGFVPSVHTPDDDDESQYFSKDLLRTCGEVPCGSHTMKLRADRTEFAEAISWATRTVGARVTLPALSGVLLDAADGRLTCRATDLEVAAEVSIPVQIDEPGRALLPGRLLAQLVAKFPEAPVELSGDAERVELNCGRATFHVRGMPVEDFPALPSPDPDLEPGPGQGRRVLAPGRPGRPGCLHRGGPPRADRRQARGRRRAADRGRDRQLPPGHAHDPVGAGRHRRLAGPGPRPAGGRQGRHRARRDRVGGARGRPGVVPARRPAPDQPPDRGQLPQRPWAAARRRTRPPS